MRPRARRQRGCTTGPDTRAGTHRPPVALRTPARRAHRASKRREPDNVSRRSVGGAGRDRSDPGIADGDRESRWRRRRSARRAGGGKGKISGDPGGVHRHRGFETGGDVISRIAVGRIESTTGTPPILAVHRGVLDDFGPPHDERGLVAQGLRNRLLEELHDFTLLHRFDVIETA